MTLFDVKYVSIQPFILQSESPSEFEMNALAIYLLGSLCFVVGALMEFSLIVLIDRLHSIRIKEDKNRKEDQQAYNNTKNFSTNTRKQLNCLLYFIRKQKF